MIDYTIKEEYLLDGWIFKGTINFKNSIPTDIIKSDDFSIKAINPVTFYGKNISNILETIDPDVELSVYDAMLKDLGYGTSAEEELDKIEANLIKNGGITFFITDKKIIIYLLPSYKFDNTMYQAFDIAQISVSFRLNDVFEEIKMYAGILPSIRRSNNFTVYKLDNTSDSVFPDDKSRVINPEESSESCSGYNFNENYIDQDIFTSANFNYNETVDGLYVSPNVSSNNADNLNSAAYEASAIMFTPITDYNIELSSYLCDPYKGTKIPVEYIMGEFTQEEIKIFDITVNDTQASYYADVFSGISGDYFVNYNSATIVQKIWPDELQSIQYRLTLECSLSEPDEE